jgi:hypothetical protein
MADELLPREQCGVNQIDAALNRLAQAVPIIKKNLIEACIHTVGADGVILEAKPNCSAPLPTRSTARCRRFIVGFECAGAAVKGKIAKQNHSQPPRSNAL